MEGQFRAELSREINASPDRVCAPLTTPGEIKEYLFGTNAMSDLKRGSAISYTGVHEGMEYHDKGRVLDAIPNKLLHTTYYSPLSGEEDKEENYKHIIYELEPKGDKTLLRFSQDNIKTDKELKQMEQNWTQVLDGLQRLVERK